MAMLLRAAALGAIIAGGAAAQPCYAELPDGSVSGLTLPRGGIREFRGLPFAQPPVGHLRWRPPVQAEPWESTLAATTFPPACAQPGPDNTVQGNESCLVSPAALVPSGPQLALAEARRGWLFTATRRLTPIVDPVRSS